jgi:hypothetical protein
MRGQTEIDFAERCQVPSKLNPFKLHHTIRAYERGSVPPF